MSDPDELCVRIRGKDLLDDAAGHDSGRRGAHGAGHGVGGMGLLHGHHAGEKVDVSFFDLLAVRGRIVRGRRDEGHLRDAWRLPCGLCVIIDQPELNSRESAHFFQKIELFRIGIQLVGKLRPGKAEVSGFREDQGVRGVYDGNLHRAVSGNVQRIDRVSCGQQAVSKCAGRLHEFELDRRRRAGNARDREIAAVLYLAVLCVDVRDDDLVRVCIIDADTGLVPGHFHQSLLDRERADAGRNIPAVSLVADERFVHRDLCEGIVHIRPGMIRLFDDRHLACHGFGAPQPVDLLLIRASHHPQEDPFPLILFFGQIRFQDVDALAGAPAHDRDGEAFQPHLLFISHCISSF